MKQIEVKHLNIGMVLAEDIVNSTGVVILSTGTELTRRNIYMMENLGYQRVAIKTEGDETEEPPNSKFSFEYQKVLEDRKEINKRLKLIYDQNIEKFKHFYVAAEQGKAPDIPKLEQIMEPAIEEALENPSIIMTFSALNEQLGEYTYKHCINVGLFSSMIGKWLGYSKKEIKDLASAGVLHDIGKSKISPEIINKPGKLTAEEFQLIKEHPQFGYDLIKEISELSEGVKMAVYQHHEKIDGSGYPNRLKGDQIHSYAKIVAVSDVYDSLTSLRSYKKAISPFKVYEMLLDMSRNHLDYFIVSSFIKNLSNFFVGNFVRLSNGEKAKIILNNKNVITRPLLLTEGGEYIDLAKHYDVSIEEIL